MATTPSLHDRLHDHVHLRDIAWLVAIALVVLSLTRGACGPWRRHRPPKQIVMSTGASDGAYHAYALRYQAIPCGAGHGTRADAVEGRRRKTSTGSAGMPTTSTSRWCRVELTREASRASSASASVFYEPVWVFYRDRASSNAAPNWRQADRRSVAGQRHGGTGPVARAIVGAGPAAGRNWSSSAGSRPPKPSRAAPSAPLSLSPPSTGRPWRSCWPRPACD